MRVRLETGPAAAGPAQDRCVAHRHWATMLPGQLDRRGGRTPTPRRFRDPEVAGILWVVAVALLLALILAVLP